MTVQLERSPRYASASARSPPRSDGYIELIVRSLRLETALELLNSEILDSNTRIWLLVLQLSNLLKLPSFCFTIMVPHI